MSDAVTRAAETDIARAKIVTLLAEQADGLPQVWKDSWRARSGMIASKIMAALDSLLTQAAPEGPTESSQADSCPPRENSCPQSGNMSESGIGGELGSLPPVSPPTASPMGDVEETAREWFFTRGLSAGMGKEIVDGDVKSLTALLLQFQGQGQWRDIDWMDIQARITNFVRIENDSEEWQGPRHHITGKKQATDAIAELIRAHGGKVTIGDKS